MKVPFLDLKAGYLPLKSEIDSAVLSVLEDQEFILGPRVDALETQMVDYVGADFAIACASGSDALLLALMVLDVQPGDEVITSPYSFFATAGSIARLGAIPVFVDIDPYTYNIQAAHLESAITPRTKVLLPVHLFGQCSDMDAIMDIARRHNLKVIEDAAQALGARWKKSSAGTMGDIGCFSFYPTKNLGAYGDGGLLTTSNPILDAKLRALRTHGGQRKYFHQYVGLNSRLDAIQAAILSTKLPYLDKWHAARQHHACQYYALFSEYNLLDQVTLPAQQLAAFHIYNQFVIRVKERDALKLFLKQRDIGTEIYYPRTLHEQDCFLNLGYARGAFPEAERAADTSLALPVYPELTAVHLRTVVAAIRDFFESRQGS